jgi:hypothetical protein
MELSLTVVLGSSGTHALSLYNRLDLPPIGDSNYYLHCEVHRKRRYARRPIDRYAPNVT